MPNKGQALRTPKASLKCDKTRKREKTFQDLIVKWGLAHVYGKKEPTRFHINMLISLIKAFLCV